MSKTIKCDICGGDIGYHYYFFPRLFKFYRVDFDGIDKTKTPKDICRRCMAKFMKFVEEENKEV